MSLMPLIALEKCIGCGLCVDVCRCGALVMADNVVTIVEVEDCGWCTRWCTQCEAVCPTGAISCPFEIIIKEP